MKFATFSNDSGPNTTGHFSPDVHPEYFVEQEDGSIVVDPTGPIAGAVQITEEQWNLSIEGKLRIDPGTKTAGEYVKTDQEAFDDAKTEKIAEIVKTFDSECAGSVDCTSVGITYTMNAGEEHANRMYNGCVLQERLAADSITVTDFSNVDHEDVPLADGFDIAVQQGAFFATVRAKKNLLRNQVINSKLEDFPNLEDALTALGQIA